jgi:hypothetical protein
LGGQNIAFYYGAFFCFFIRVLKGNWSTQIFRDFNLDFWGQIQKSGQKKKGKKNGKTKKNTSRKSVGVLDCGQGFPTLSQDLAY